MQGPLRPIVRILGFALVVVGSLGLAMSVLGRDPSAPEVHDKVVIPPSPPAPADGDGSGERRLEHGTITMVQIVHDGGQVGWVFFLALGVGLAVLARPRRPGRASAP